jgi:riboflavin kinase/FMN adenylyltransferase
VSSANAQPGNPLERVGPGPHVITIGNFDGVHRGHRYLLGLVRQRADAAHARAVVITFEPHPTAVLRPEQPFERLAAPAEKRQLLHAAGIDDVVVLPFTREFAALTPDAFLDELTRSLQPVAIYVGKGFRFGAKRAGDGATLAAYAAAHGFDAIVVERLADDDASISSSTVRAALKRGDLPEAERALGRRYRLRGRVEHCAARGRELGYPTANLELPADACVPMDGIYAAYAHVEARELGPRQAMVYIGPRPTFDNGARMVEVNILDFAGDLYTLELEIEFVTFVRPDAVFATVDELVERIALDEAETRAVLAVTPPEPQTTPT